MVNKELWAEEQGLTYLPLYVFTVVSARMSVQNAITKLELRVSLQKVKGVVRIG